MSNPAIHLFLAIFLLLGGIPLRATAEESAAVDPAATLGELQRFYSGLTSLEFSFSQVTRSGGRERSGEGRAVLYRPCPADRNDDPQCRSILRWTYTAPEQQIILNDGTRLSFFNQTDNQLLLASAEDMEQDITYGLLSGARDLAQDFSARQAGVETADEKSPTLQALRLIPSRPHPQVKSILVWFDRDLLIRRLVLEDHFGTVTILNFTDIRIDRLEAGDPAVRKQLLFLPLEKDTEIIHR